jgi:MATE family, multidrug efflux pump
MLYGAVDTVFTGHASATDLAAMGLGTGVYSTVFVSLLGVTNALNPIIGQHHGGGRHAAIGVSYVQGLWLALLLSLAGGLFLAFPEPWLAWIHAPTDVEALVTRYLRVLAVALPASLMFRVISALNIAVARPQVVMRLQVVGRSASCCGPTSARWRRPWSTRSPSGGSASSGAITSPFAGSGGRRGGSPACG